MVRCLALASLLVAWMLPATPRVASGQGEYVHVAARGPRFLSAEVPAGAPVDASAAAPLHRRVTLALDRVPLDEALQAVIAQAGLEIAYSGRIVPLTRRVSLHAREITVAAALTEVLLDAGVDVSVTRTGELALVRRSPPMAVTDTAALVGRVMDKSTGTPLAGAAVTVSGRSRSVLTADDGRYRLTGLASGTYTLTARYIGYLPSTVSATVADSDGVEVVTDFALERSAQRLDQVVVTGTVVPTEVRALPTPISIVTGEEIQRKHLQRVDQIFRGDVPGTIGWDSGPDDFFSIVGVRGTTSLNRTPTIKAYVDGVEVADPSFIANIDPAIVDRIEVTRGPQASTVYGSDASGGVMQIFTKRGSANTPAQFSGRAEVGTVDGQYRDGLALRQNYSLSLAGGGSGYSYSLGGSYVQAGEWTPEYFSRAPHFFAGGKWTNGPLQVSLSARYMEKAFATTFSPALSDLSYYSRPSYQDADVRAGTYGAQATYRVTPRWQHTLILGYDQSLYDFRNTRARLTTPADTFLMAGGQQDGRASVRYNTSYDLRLGDGIAATMTGGLEYADASHASTLTVDATRTTGTLDGVTFFTRTPVTNTGYFGQLQVGVRDAFFVTAGLRGERNDNFGADYGTDWSPRLGASYVRQLGRVSVKLRGSWGNAIRAPQPYQKVAETAFGSNQIANPFLGPERQKGWDAGVDVDMGAAWLGVTYYDQTAIDLIDVVTTDPTTDVPETQYQNVGRIKNTGVEVEAGLSFSHFNVRGTYSRPGSTVRRLSPDYGGELRVGDALLGVPRHMAGGTVTYRPGQGTDLSLGVTHIGSWTDTDALALYQYFFGNAPYRGSGRDYWVQYPSVTKFNLSASQRVTAHVLGFVHIDNVGNNRRAERTNLNVQMGRAMQVGMQVQY